MSGIDDVIDKVQSMIRHRDRFDSGEPYSREACYTEDGLPDIVNCEEITMAAEEAWTQRQKCSPFDRWVCPIHFITYGGRLFAFDVVLSNAGVPASSLAEVKLMAELICKSLNQNLNDPEWCRTTVPSLVRELKNYEPYC